MIETQRDWLDYLNRVAVPLDVSLKVCYKVDRYRFGMNEISEYPINHRVILPNEIVIECDRELEQNREFAKVIASYLDELDIPFIVGYSGGKSFHFHIFMDWHIDISKATEKRLVERGFRFYMARNVLAEKIFLFIERMEIKVFGDSKLDYANLYPNKLIREFGGQHDNGRYKTYVDDFDKVDGLKYPPEIRLWNANSDMKEAIRIWRPKPKKTYHQVFSP